MVLTWPIRSKRCGLINDVLSKSFCLWYSTTDFGAMGPCRAALRLKDSSASLRCSESQLILDLGGGARVGITGLFDVDEGAFDRSIPGADIRRDVLAPMSANRASGLKCQRPGLIATGRATLTRIGLA